MSFFLASGLNSDKKALATPFNQMIHIMMSSHLMRLLLLSFCLIDMACGGSATATTHQTSEEWESLCRDRIGGTLIWNKEKDIAVLYMNLGADAYSYYYFCFKKDEHGRMLPLAVFSTRSDYLHPTEVKILPSGIQVTLSDRCHSHCTPFFSFESQRATLEIWKNMDPSEIFSGTPLYEELKF